MIREGDQNPDRIGGGRGGIGLAIGMSLFSTVAADS